jgi:hypothetical protein
MRRRLMTSKKRGQAPKVKLQHMDFQPLMEDDSKVVYRAEINDDKAPGKPVWRMTVTAARPKNEEEKEKLEGFMKEMEVGFVLTPPHPEDDTDDDQEPVPDLDLENEILIEHQLVRTRTLDGTSGATVVVSTLAEGEDPESESGQLRSASEALAAGKLVRVGAKSHRWAARGGVSTTATATAKQGSGRIRNQKASSPNTLFRVGSNPGKKKGKTVWVVASGGTCKYLFTGNFNGPYAD